MKLKLKINDNRSTMLSVKWEPDCHTGVSPPDVSAGTKERDGSPRLLSKAEGQIDCSDSEGIYRRQSAECWIIPISSTVTKLYSQGNVYNLKKIYDELNEEYYDGKLNLSITWFGKPWQRPRSRVTFGLYHDSLRLIKINRLLDSPSFPDYLVAYVVFHEMVHHVCPAYMDENGYHQIHSKEFKAEEARYRHFALAERWIKENQANFFDF